MHSFSYSLLAFFLIVFSTSSLALNPTEAARALRASASVMSSSYLLNRSLSFCSENYPQIKQQMDSGYHHWLAANDDVIQKSRFVYQYILDDIRREGGDKMADDFDKDMLKKMEKVADNVIAKFRKDYSQNFDQTCLKMIEDINSSKRDIKNKNTAYYQQLINIKTE